MQPVQNPEITAYIAKGYIVAAESESTVTLHRPATKVNHILHLILTILTVGIWAIVWIIVAVASKGSSTVTLQRYMTVEHGHVAR